MCWIPSIRFWFSTALVDPNQRFYMHRWRQLLFLCTLASIEVRLRSAKMSCLDRLYSQIGTRSLILEMKDTGDSFR